MCKRAGEIYEWFTSHGVHVSSLDLGGGLGIDYQNPDAAKIPDFEGLLKVIRKNLNVPEDVQIHIEPGRSIVAQCGSLISRVVFVKEGRVKKFMILDAGMNDLIRPALYGAYHSIENLSSAEAPDTYDIVGPVCESSDVWGCGRSVSRAKRGDLIAIRSAGAYGQTMSMKYNCRKLAKAYYV